MWQHYRFAAKRWVAYFPRRFAVPLPQQPEPPVLPVSRTLLREEGAAALYRGVAPAMLRAFPANAACFFGVDLAKSILGSAGL